MSDLDKKERALQRRIQTARDLEARGHVDHAVKEYLRAKAPEEAARLLASKGRLKDAGQAILDGLKVQPEEVGALDAAGRALASQAATFFQQGNASGVADVIRAALASAPAPTSAAPPQRSSDGSGGVSSPPDGRAPSPPDGRGAPSSASPRPPPAGTSSKPPGRAPAIGSGSFRPPVAASGSFRPPVSGSGSFRAPVTGSGTFRPPVKSSAPPITIRRPAPAAPEGAPSSSRPPTGPGPSSTRPPSAPVSRSPIAPAPSSSRPEPSTDAGDAVRPRVSSGSFRPPPGARPPVATARPASSDPAAPAASEPTEAPASSPAAARRPLAPPIDATASQRLSASGDVVSEYSGSRESGWRDADGSAIDLSIEEHLAAGRKGAAARIARDAGRFEQALEWFRELELHMQAGACLRALGRPDEALAELLSEDPGGPNYRKACFELVPIAIELGRIDFDIDRFLTRFIQEGPKDRDEIDTYLELARLYVRAEFPRGARRCVAKILESDKHHAGAKALRAELERGNAPAPRTLSSAPATARGLPALPSLDEFIQLAREHAPRD